MGMGPDVESACFAVAIGIAESAADYELGEGYSDQTDLFVDYCEVDVAEVDDAGIDDLMDLRVAGSESLNYSIVKNHN